MLFSTSESNAVAAAMTYLDRPLITQNVVTAVFEGTPADGVLLPKDEILSINGTEVTRGHAGGRGDPVRADRHDVRDRRAS